MQLVDFPIALCADIMQFQVHVYTISNEEKPLCCSTLVKYSLANECDAHCLECIFEYIVCHFSYLIRITCTYLNDKTKGDLNPLPRVTNI